MNSSKLDPASMRGRILIAVKRSIAEPNPGGPARTTVKAQQNLARVILGADLTDTSFGLVIAECEAMTNCGLIRYASSTDARVIITPVEPAFTAALTKWHNRLQSRVQGYIEVSLFPCSPGRLKRLRILVEIARHKNGIAASSTTSITSTLAGLIEAKCDLETEAPTYWAHLKGLQKNGYIVIAVRGKRISSAVVTTLGLQMLSDSLLRRGLDDAEYFALLAQL